MRPTNFSLLTTVLAICAVAALAMPPHPDLAARIESDEISAPYFLAQHDNVVAAGINQNTLAPWAAEFRERHSLDDNFSALAILVDFSDNPSSVAPSAFDQLLFANAQGSVRHFYSQISYGNLTIVTLNLPSSMGWTRAPQSYAYYVNGQNGMGGYPRNTQRLVEDVVALVDPLVNFNNYDNDGDGYVDALFVIHAGSGAELTGNSNHIWSHQWAITPRLCDGVYAYIYSVEPEFWQSPGDMTCGVYAHELGHAAFGLPDLYDYGNDSRGLGKWSLMAGGSWNGTLGNTPAHPDAWCRIRMGFASPIVISSTAPAQSIPSVQNSGSIFKLVSITAATQYALVENRQQSGYDAALPGNGLLIYQVDDGVSGNNNQWYPGHTTSGHYQVALEQADALWQLEQNINSGNSGDPYPGSANNRAYTQTSSPNSNDYAGGASGISVTNISNSAATMTADLAGALPASITVLSPNGGGTWIEGDTDTIRWSSTSLNENVKIELNRSYPSGAWVTLVASCANTGQYPRSVPTGTSSAARIRISGTAHTGVSDVSNSNFTITRRSMTVTSPNTNLTWVAGDSADITWTSQSLNENVKIEIDYAYPSSWTQIAASVSNSGAFRWRVTGNATATARIRISGTTHTAVRDTSNSNFTIGIRRVVVTAPNSAVTWVVGDNNNITWTSSNLAEPVKIELCRNYPSSSWQTIVDSTANDGSYAWNVTSPLSSAARVRISGAYRTSIADTSNTNFVIGARTISVTRPNAALTFVTGGPDTIRWASTNLSGNIRVDLNRDYPSGAWETLVSAAANTGSYVWNVSGASSTSARVVISSVTYPSIRDTCDTNFSILQATITVQNPNGGGTWIEGDTDTLRWSSTNISENVKIELNRSYPNGSWVVLAASVPNTGAYPRTIPTGTSTSARVRISGVAHTATTDISDANFTIARRSINVTSPNSEVTWIVGDSMDVAWSSQLLSENVNIEINRSYPSVAWTTLASNVSNSGSFRWLVSGASTTARIRITGVTHSSVRDTSNANFIIAARSITVTAPNTSSVYCVGDIGNIRWSSTGVSEQVKLEVNRNYPTGAWEIIADSTTNDGHFAWTVAAPLTSAARVRISGIVHASVSDVSDANFTIGLRSVSMSRPNGGEIFVIGRSDTVRWSTTNLAGNLQISLNRNYPSGVWEVLAASATNIGWYRWVPSGALSESARVRIISVSFPSIGDTSAASFSLRASGISREPSPPALDEFSAVTEFSLEQNYPNPFNSTTTIRFALPNETPVTLSVFNIKGQLVTSLLDQQLHTGIHELHWKAQDNDSKPLPSGAYLIVLRTPHFVETRKAIFIR